MTELRPIDLRALRRLQAIGPSRLKRWKSQHKRHDGVKLQAAVIHRLWYLRLVSFDWFEDFYALTAAGIAAIAAVPPLLARAA